MTGDDIIRPVLSSLKKRWKVWISSAQLHEVQPALPSSSQTKRALAHCSLAQLFCQACSSRLSTAPARLSHFNQLSPKINVVYLKLSPNQEIPAHQTDSFNEGLVILLQLNLQSWTWNSKPSRQKVFSHHLPQSQIMFTRVIFTTRLPLNCLSLSNRTTLQTTANSASCCNSLFTPWLSFHLKSDPSRLMSFKCFFLNTAAVDFASEQLQTAVGRIMLLSHVVRRVKIPPAQRGQCDWGLRLLQETGEKLRASVDVASLPSSPC